MAAAPRTALLARGDIVGVVSSGFAVRPADLRQGLDWLERHGFRPRLGRHVLAREGYLAGTDEQRAEDLVRALRDPDVRAIWFARGGYGTARLLGRVPWAELRRDPKTLIGYSDLTALFAPALERTDCRCLYGPGVAELGQPGRFHRASLLRTLAGSALVCKIAPSQVLVPGNARGRLLGGNLSVLTHLCGTRFMPDLRGALLFLEEVGEQAYRVDRLLTQLAAAGAFRGLAGVVLGSFLVPPRRRFPPDRALDDLLQERFAALGVPVVRGLPAGHLHGKWTLPLGGTAHLQTRAGRLTLRP